MTTRIKLSWKLAYGSGDWSISSLNTLRQIFYAIFLTDVVGLEPQLASVAALLGIVWDAVNDPLVGALSDRIRTRWGRRRPFLLLFAIPFGLVFLLLWWAPPWESQLALAATVMVAYMLSDTVQTLVSVPFYALTPEIAPDYDDRTSLTGYRMFFNLLASLATAVAAPMIVDGALKAGHSQQQGYLIVATAFGCLAVLPFLLIVAMVRERSPGDIIRYDEQSIRDVMATVWANVPFRSATGLYLLNWITFDLVALMLPYYLVYRTAGGDLLASVTLIGAEFPLESAVLGILLITAVAALPLWIWISSRFGKRNAYIAGMIFWAAVQLVIFGLPAGHVTWVLILAILAGIGVSTAHILPDAIFPDVLDWAELRTGRRNEGVYYGIKNLIRKLTAALAIFIALQVLGWSGYQAPVDGATRFSQSATTLTAIRLLTGPAGALLLLGAIAVAWFYPLTRERHARVQQLLERRRKRTVSG
jgi:GPH family glycoside/pentoside/hexuronide:cation symporter